MEILQKFLQKLRKRYGDISLGGILSRFRKIFGKVEDETPPPISENPKVETPPPIPENPKVETPPVKNFTINEKFSPVNIDGMKSWAELRAVVLDLHYLKDFFAGKQDSQSPQFLNIIETYKNSAEKKLSPPHDFDETASYIFVEKLAGVIKKRFYTILKACAPGISGKGAEPASYYKNILERVKNYFANIGLKSANVNPKDNFRDWMEHMEAVATIPTPFEHLDNLISEIIVQPYFFEYYNDDGEIEKFWIDGECTVFKKQGGN